MDYTRIKQEIEKEIKESKEQESVNSFNNVMSDLDVEMIK